MKKLLASLLCVMMVFCMMPGLAFATEGMGNVTGLTEGIEVTENGTSTVTVQTANPGTLVWHPKDDSIGRYADGWWVGVRVTAPETLKDLTDAGDKDVKYKYRVYYEGYAASEYLDRSFYTNQDSPKDDPASNYMGIWLPVSPEILSYGKNLIYEYEFDWNRDTNYEQKVKIVIDPKKAILKQDGNTVYPVATVGSNGYATLPMAISAATDGQTVTLSKDVELTGTQNITKDLTIDLNGHNITCNGNRAIHVKSGTLTLDGTGVISSNNEIKNGEFSDSSSVIRVGDNNGTAATAGLNIGEGVTISSPYCYGVTVFGSKTKETIVVDGKIKVTGSAGALSGNGSAGYGNTSITINPTAEITAENDAAIYHPQSGTLTINGGTIVGTSAIECKAGDTTVVVSGNPTITATGNVDNSAPNSNGTSSRGYAVAVVENAAYAGGARVTIESGNYTGAVGIRKDNEVAVEKKGSIVITGGTFSSDVSPYADHANKYYAFPTQDSKYTVLFAGIEGDWRNPKNLTVGQTYKLEFSPGNQYVTWSSADEKIATVDEKTGLVTAKSAGSVVITAKVKSEEVIDSAVRGSELEAEFNISYPYVPTTPTTPTDNVTNSGSTTAGNATTSADLSNTTSTSNGTTTATVDKTTADKIVDKAVSNKSEEVVIDATANTTTAADSTVIAQVGIPTAALEAIAEKTEADVTVKTDVAEVKLDNTAAGAVAEQAAGDTVQLVVEKVAEDAEKVQFELKVVCSEGNVISDFKGGNVAVTVAVPKAMESKEIVCVYIDENGRISKVNGQKNADGTYTFFTGHFSTYALMTAEEADAAIEAQAEEIKNIKIKLQSKQVKLKNGKKAIKLTWTADSDVDFDGVEIYRSTKRYSGFGKTPIYTATKDVYYNTAVKNGTKYYYKVKAYVEVEGVKYYTDYSTKAWRTVK